MLHLLNPQSMNSKPSFDGVPVRVANISRSVRKRVFNNQLFVNQFTKQRTSKKDVFVMMNAAERHGVLQLWVLPSEPTGECGIRIVQRCFQPRDGHLVLGAQMRNHVVDPPGRRRIGR